MVNLLTEQAKETQKENPKLDGYSKAVSFYSTDEMVLSDYNDSYVEFSVLLNNTNYKSRLTQICEFDIARSLGYNGSIQYFDGNWDNPDGKSFHFFNERVLFADKNPGFEVTENNVEGEEISVYVLPHGKQDINFTPEYSGNYQFDIKDSTGLTLTVTDSNGNKITANNSSFRLMGGLCYTVTINSSDSKKITSLKVKIAKAKNTGTLTAGETFIFKTDADYSKIYSFSVSQANINIQNILIRNANKFIQYEFFEPYIPAPTIDIPLEEGTYYIILSNDSLDSMAYSLSMDECFIGHLGENAVTPKGNNCTYLKISGLSNGEYALNSTNDDVWYNVLDDN